MPDKQAAKRTWFSVDGIAAPFRHSAFRRIWIAGLLSNFGLNINGVGAAWEMTQMTSSPGMVALVQTALMLPLMLLSLAAGAIADMYDRRLVSICALLLGLSGGVILTLLVYFGRLTPNSLLLFCFIIGSGMALFVPSWQASVSEQVPAETLPSAVALSGINYNIARIFGPAVGGVIVAIAGTVASFLANVLLYLPLLVVLLLWRRIQEPSRLPPERLQRAMVSGARYIIHSPSIRTVVARTLIMALMGGAIHALMPLIARDTLSGTAQTYGILLGCFGIGGVLGALNVSTIRKYLDSETSTRLCALVLGITIAICALSHSSLLTAAALVLAGAAWMVALTLFNIGIQLAAPRWVAGRALAAYQAATAGGVAGGSWMWGSIAGHVGVSNTLLIAGGAMFISPLVAFWLRMPSIASTNTDAAIPLAEPEVNLAITPRSGPIIVEVDFRVPQDKARTFYDAMLKVEGIRKRNGAYGWSISRDLADPEIWTERFHCPTWLDYLRLRDRPTQAERELSQIAMDFHTGSELPKARRMLERPFGSVRWKDETPDRAEIKQLPLVPPPSSTL